MISWFRSITSKLKSSCTAERAYKTFMHISLAMDRVRVKP